MSQGGDREYNVYDFLLEKKLLCWNKSAKPLGGDGEQKCVYSDGKKKGNYTHLISV